MQQPPGQPPQWQPPPSGYGPPGAPPPSYGYPQGYGQQGYAPQPPPQKRGGHGWIIALVVVGGALLLLGGGAVVLFLVMASSAGDSATGPGGGVAGRGGGGGITNPLHVVRSPQTVVDEEMAVDANGLQWRPFTLPDDRPVQVTAEGKKHTDKGYTVMVMDQSNCNELAGGKRTGLQGYAAFDGIKITSYTKTGTLSGGSYCVAVANTENIINTMVVHLKVMVDPQ